MNIKRQRIPDCSQVKRFSDLVAFTHESKEPFIRQEGLTDEKKIAVLTQKSFGPGRYVKAAERLREDNKPLHNLSYVIEINNYIVGSIRLWPVTGYSKRKQKNYNLLLLGPISVDIQQRKKGLARWLITKALDGVQGAEFEAILLVGEPNIFEPYGFTIAPNLVLPGPVDHKRVMIRQITSNILIDDPIIIERPRQR